jgi:murein DD-endopeptidase MepM/ murein hydrolase activator NlpD
MPKHKYRFNPESLSYDKIRLSFKDILIKLFTFFTASIVISVLYYIVFSSFFNSPKEKNLIRENSKLELQYEMLEKRLAQIDKVLDDMQHRDDNIYRTIFEAEPIPRTIREAGFGGTNRYVELEGFDNSDLIIETTRKLDKISKRLYVQSKSYDEIIEKALNKEDMLASIPAIQPISNKDLTRTASGYGWRIHPIYKIKKFHEGIDFTAPVGTDIYATGNGTVVDLDRNPFRGYGNMVRIDHGFGYTTLYAHMNSINVKLGQVVRRGDVIGTVGNSGLSTAPHLHFEVSKNGKKVNPINFFFNDLSPEEYDRMIEISTNNGQTFD